MLRIYALMWLLVGGSTVGLYLAGYLNAPMFTIIGFLTATLVFLGMLLMVPFSLSEQPRPIDRGQTQTV